MKKSSLQKLKYYRKINKLTQSELAKQMNVERYCIADWEQGRSEPSLENLTQLSTILGVSIENLTDTEYIKINESSDEELIKLIKK